MAEDPDLEWAISQVETGQSDGRANLRAQIDAARILIAECLRGHGLDGEAATPGAPKLPKAIVALELAARSICAAAAEHFPGGDERIAEYALRVAVELAELSGEHLAHFPASRSKTLPLVIAALCASAGAEASFGGPQPAEVVH